MDPETQAVASDGGNSAGSAAGSIASDLAAKHGASQVGGGAAPVGAKRGRRTVAEEAAAWLQNNGLVAVPVASSDNAGGDPVGVPPDGVPVPPGSVVVSPEFAAECAEILLHGLIEWRVASVYRRALRICKDEQLSRDLAAESAPPPGTVGVMSKSLALIVQKHELDVGPEWVLGGAALNWFRLDSKLDRKLKELESASPKA